MEPRTFAEMYNAFRLNGMKAGVPETVEAKLEVQAAGMERVPVYNHFLPKVHPHMVLEDMFHLLYLGTGKEHLTQLLGEIVRLHPLLWTTLHSVLRRHYKLNDIGANCRWTVISDFTGSTAYDIKKFIEVSPYIIAQGNYLPLDSPSFSCWLVFVRMSTLLSSTLLSVGDIKELLKLISIYMSKYVGKLLALFYSSLFINNTHRCLIYRLLINPPSFFIIAI